MDPGGDGRRVAPRRVAEIWLAIPLAGIVIGAWCILQEWRPEATAGDNAENALELFINISLPALLTPLVVRRSWFVNPLAYLFAAAVALVALVAVVGVIYNAITGIELSFAAFNVLVFGAPILVLATPIAAIFGLLRPR